MDLQLRAYFIFFSDASTDFLDCLTAESLPVFALGTLLLVLLLVGSCRKLVQLLLACGRRCIRLLRDVSYRLVRGHEAHGDASWAPRVKLPVPIPSLVKSGYLGDCAPLPLRLQDQLLSLKSRAQQRWHMM